MGLKPCGSVKQSKSLSVPPSVGLNNFYVLDDETDPIEYEVEKVLDKRDVNVPISCLLNFRVKLNSF